jgi:hypothetical protein
MTRRGRTEEWDPDEDPMAEAFDEDLDPEGPSREDLARFGRETLPCPHCGREVHADAAACPRCHRWLDDDPQPAEAAAMRGRAKLLLVGTLVAMLLGLGWCAGGRGF